MLPLGLGISLIIVSGTARSLLFCLACKPHAAMCCSLVRTSCDAATPNSGGVAQAHV